MPAKRPSISRCVGADTLDRELADGLKRMVGFRNVAVHDYQRPNLDIVRAILQRDLDDLLAFARVGVASGGS